MEFKGPGGMNEMHNKLEKFQPEKEAVMHVQQPECPYCKNSKKAYSQRTEEITQLKETLSLERTWLKSHHANLELAHKRESVLKKELWETKLFIARLTDDENLEEFVEWRTSFRGRNQINKSKKNEK